MVKENISQAFRLKNIEKKRNYLIEDINRNELTGKKHKKICITPNYIEYFLILASTITECVSIFAFYSSIGIPKGSSKNLCNNSRN